MATIGEAEDLLGQVMGIEEACDELIEEAGLSRKARALNVQLISEYREEIESWDPETPLSAEAENLFGQLKEAMESFGS